MDRQSGVPCLATATAGSLSDDQAAAGIPQLAYGSGVSPPGPRGGDEHPHRRPARIACVLRPASRMIRAGMTGKNFPGHSNGPTSMTRRRPFYRQSERPARASGTPPGRDIYHRTPPAAPWRNGSDSVAEQHRRPSKVLPLKLSYPRSAAYRRLRSNGTGHPLCGFGPTSRSSAVRADGRSSSACYSSAVCGCGAMAGFPEGGVAGGAQ